MLESPPSSLGKGFLSSLGGNFYKKDAHQKAADMGKPGDSSADANIQNLSQEPESKEESAEYLLREPEV